MTDSVPEVRGRAPYRALVCEPSRAQEEMRRPLSPSEARALRFWLASHGGVSDPARRESLIAIWMATRAWEILMASLRRRFPHREANCECVLQEAFAKLLEAVDQGVCITFEMIEIELSAHRLWCRATDAYRREVRMDRVGRVFELGYVDTEAPSKISEKVSHAA